MAEIKSRRQNTKTAWILALPETMPVREVIAKAKAEGMTLARAQVYFARKRYKPRAKPGKATTSRPTEYVETDLAVVRRVAFQLGFSAVDAFMQELKREVGL